MPLKPNQNKTEQHNHLLLINRCPFIHLSVNIIKPMSSIFIHYEFPRIPQSQCSCILYNSLNLFFSIKSVSLILLQVIQYRSNIPLLDSRIERVWGTTFVNCISYAAVSCQHFHFPCFASKDHGFFCPSSKVPCCLYCVPIEAGMQSSVPLTSSSTDT